MWPLVMDICCPFGDSAEILPSSSTWAPGWSSPSPVGFTQPLSLFWARRAWSPFLPLRVGEPANCVFTRTWGSLRGSRPEGMSSLSQQRSCRGAPGPQRPLPPRGFLAPKGLSQHSVPKPWHPSAPQDRCPAVPLAGTSLHPWSTRACLGHWFPPVT